MKQPKLGQKFWMRDNEIDFECLTVSITRRESMIGTKHANFTVEATQLNDFHISFFQEKDRTKTMILRYEDKTWTLKDRQGNWVPFTKQMLFNKPADLKTCEHKQEDYDNFLENASRYM